jgi:hypothetical protein
MIPKRVKLIQFYNIEERGLPVAYLHIMKYVLIALYISISLHQVSYIEQVTLLT